MVGSQVIRDRNGSVEVKRAPRIQGSMPNQTPTVSGSMERKGTLRLHFDDYITLMAVQEIFLIKTRPKM